MAQVRGRASQGRAGQKRESEIQMTIPPRPSRAAIKLMRRLSIPEASALGRLIISALQPTRFRNIQQRDPARPLRTLQRAAGKAAKQFEDLVAEAVAVGVDDDHLKVIYHVCTPAHPKYREQFCDGLRDAILMARRRKWTGCEDRNYTLKELRDICARSGSRFFIDLKQGERVHKLGGRNRVSVKTMRSAREYRFVCEQGDFVSVTSNGDCAEVQDTVTVGADQSRNE